MKLVDTNVWLAVTLSAHPFHKTARAWLEMEQTAGDLLFCRSTQQSLLRLLTTAAALRPFGNPPLTNTEAWTVYEGQAAARAEAVQQAGQAIDVAGGPYSSPA